MNLPPLVAPLAEITPEEVGRYSRHILIPEIGRSGQRRIKTSKVLVVGAGGLGSPTLLYLAAAGIGTLGIVEFDVVEESNLQRQIIHRVGSIGNAKTESAAQSIRQLNPYVKINLHDERLNSTNVEDIFSPYDLIIDGSDNFATRYLVNDACVILKKPYVWGSIYRFEGQASVFWEQAPDGAGINYRDLYPEPPPPEHAPSCSEGGVLGVLCAAIGSVMVTEAIKLITGIGDSLLGRLLIYDALDMRYRSVLLRRSPERKPITTLIDYELFCGLNKAQKPAGNDLPSIEALQLKALQDSGRPFHLIDVREPNEWDIARIGSALLIPKQKVIDEGLPEHIPRDANIIVHCKSGARAKDALVALQQQGFHNLRYLEGGIIAWAEHVDTSLPSY